MVPKPLYELIPYLYLLTGSAIIVGLGGYTTPVGLLLFAMGAWLWLMRSDYRRINRRQPLGGKRSFFLSRALYELLPFGYVLLGLLIFGLLDHPLRLFSGPLMVALGLAVLMLRSSQRKKPQPVVHLRERDAEPIAPTLAVDHSVDHSIDHSVNNSIDDLIDQAYTQLILTEPVFAEAQYQPSSANCASCQIVDICDSVKLSPQAVQEIMRLNQTLSPHDAFELYHERVEDIEKRRVSEVELQSALKLLYRYSDLCATWRKTGRLGTL